MNITRSFINILLIQVAIITVSCSEDWALKEETFAIAGENNKWVAKETDSDSFIMMDSAGISQGYIISNEEYYLDKSWGGFLGLNTHMTFTEYRSRSYESTYDFDYSISIRAATWEPYGDKLRVAVAGTVFRFDLLLREISEVALNSSYNSYSETSDGYMYDTKIASTCELLDSVSINNQKWKDVLHFTLKDFTEQWGNFTVTGIYVSRGKGLIRYELNNGISYNLMPEEADSK